MEEIVPPCQSVVRLFFVDVSAKDFFCIYFLGLKIFAGTSPAGPPTLMDVGHHFDDIPLMARRRRVNK